MEQETLEYRLNRMEEQNEKILMALEELKENMPHLYVSNQLYRSEMADLERRVAELEKSKNAAFWAILAGGGSLIFSLFRFVIGF